MIIGLLGVSGSGQTTLAEKLYNKYHHLHWVDGDILREQTSNFDYTEKGRILNIYNVEVNMDKSILDEPVG